jgi:hypothetical protein
MNVRNIAPRKYRRFFRSTLSKKSVRKTDGRIRINTHLVVIAQATSIPARMLAMYEPLLNTRTDIPRSPKVKAGISPWPPKPNDKINAGLREITENAKRGRSDL